MESQKKSKVCIEVSEGQEITVNVTKAELEMVEKECKLAREAFEKECRRISAKYAGA